MLPEDEDLHQISALSYFLESRTHIQLSKNFLSPSFLFRVAPKVLWVDQNIHLHFPQGGMKPEWTLVNPMLLETKERKLNIC